MDDTIVAISSAPGRGPLGIVRLSGPMAVAIAERMLEPADGEPLHLRPQWRRIAGEIRAEPGARLPTVLYLFRAPHSYTRQDLVEVHTVGSPPALEMVRRRAIALGAVAAVPGEFTARAFINGAMDLASAEAVAGVVRAQSDTQLRASRGMMDGVLAQQMTQARDELAEVLALVEADIDFAEEPVEFITPADLGARLTAVDASLRRMLAESQSIEQFDVLPRILLLGPPNAGKSTLMNRLCGTSRAICAAVAGTTRDVLSAPIRVGRGEAILLDAGGVDQSREAILALARDRTLAAAERVDLVCVVLDVAAIARMTVNRPSPEGSLTAPSRGTDGEDAGRGVDEFLALIRSIELPRSVVAANKCDLLPAQEAQRLTKWLESLRLGPLRLVSALNGTGIDDLRSALAGELGEAATTTLGEAMLLSERQRRAITEGAEALERAAELNKLATETIDRADVLAFELREALEALGAVTGAVTTEDLLARVFANFCIGK